MSNPIVTYLVGAGIGTLFGSFLTFTIMLFMGKP